MLFFGFEQLLKIHAITILKEKPTKESCFHLRHKNMQDMYATITLELN